jgi:hypothetical protein
MRWKEKSRREGKKGKRASERATKTLMKQTEKEQKSASKKEAQKKKGGAKNEIAMIVSTTRTNKAEKTEYEKGKL